jgi:hypothetical protein
VRLRFSVLGIVFCLAAALTACGGGGAGSAPVTSLPAVTPTPGGTGVTPSPVPTATAVPTATPVATATPASQSAPATGLLAAIAGGAFGGTTAAGATGATLVGVATGLQGSTGAAVTTAGSTSVGVNGIGGNTVRRTAGRPAIEAASEVEFQPLVSKRVVRDALPSVRRRAPGELATESARRPRALPTALGATAKLWAQNAAIGSSGGTYIQIDATLAAVTAHGSVWVDSSLTSVLTTPTTIAAIGSDFENAWASNNAHFGTDAYDATLYAPASACDAAGNVIGTTLPYPPHDLRTIVFVVNPASLGGGVGGYFDSVNFFTDSFLQCFASARAAGAHSNAAPMIYLGWFGPGGGSNPLTFTLQQDLVRGTAHEYQHLLNFVGHVVRLNGAVFEDAFIDEGLSMLAQDLALPRMFPQLSNDALDAVTRANRFLDAPQNFSLTGFSGIDNAANSTTPKYNCSGCYGASYVFQRYLYDRFGGDAYLAQVETGKSVGLAKLGTVTGQAPDVLLSDFGLTLAAGGATTDARYRITGFPFGSSLTTQLGGTVSVHTPAKVNAAPGSGLFAGPFNGGYILVAVPGAGSNVTIREKTGAFTFKAGIAQH